MCRQSCGLGPVHTEYEVGNLCSIQHSIWVGIKLREWYSSTSWKTKGISGERVGFATRHARGRSGSGSGSGCTGRAEISFASICLASHAIIDFLNPKHNGRRHKGAELERFRRRQSFCRQAVGRCSTCIQGSGERQPHGWWNRAHGRRQGWRCHIGRCREEHHSRGLVQVPQETLRKRLASYRNRSWRSHGWRESNMEEYDLARIYIRTTLKRL